jgi:hypothetical protein
MADARPIFAGNFAGGRRAVQPQLADRKSVTAIALAVIAIAEAVALRRAGGDFLTVGPMALLLINHPSPTGTLGMLALLGAAFCGTCSKWTGTVADSKSVCEW